MRANLPDLRCHNRVGALKGLWIPTAVRMTGGGMGVVDDENALLRGCRRADPGFREGR